LISFKSLEQKVFLVNDANFEEIALKVFEFQASNNTVYSSFLNHLKIDHTNIQSIDEIPFMPISFYKSQKVVSGEWKESEVFTSSGTSGQERSQHFVKDLDFYNKVCRKCFESFYNSPDDFIIFALLPSYLEREGSSLIYMVDNFMQDADPDSGFYLNDFDQLIQNIKRARLNNKNILLIGVSFALLELAEKGEIDLSGSIIMETGGMKGRRKEIVRSDLHNRLKRAFHVNEIHSEYGMTELMSQAYAIRDGRFQTPPWMRVFTRDLNDPFSYLKKGATGGINVVDLTNLYSCSFVETEDMGRIIEGDKFEILGRIDNSEIRGCNLLVTNT